MASLAKYAAIGGFSCYGLGVLYKTQVNGKLRNTKYFKDAMCMLELHKASDQLLGKPIFTSNMDVFSSKNYVDQKFLKLFVPVRGSKGKGELFFSATRNDVGDDWTVTRVELELTDNLGGTVLIFDSSKYNDNNSNNDS